MLPIITPRHRILLADGQIGVKRILLGHDCEHLALRSAALDPRYQNHAGDSMTPETTQALGTAATLYGLGGALSVLLQARQIHVRGTSGDVSARFFAVYVGGFAIWLLYGLSIGSIPIILVHAVGLLCGTTTLAVVLRLRKPAAVAAPTRLAREDRARVRPGQPVPHDPEHKARPVGMRASRQTSPLAGSRSLSLTHRFEPDPGRSSCDLWRRKTRRACARCSLVERGRERGARRDRDPAADTR